MFFYEFGNTSQNKQVKFWLVVRVSIYLKNFPDEKDLVYYMD